MTEVVVNSVTAACLAPRMAKSLCDLRTENGENSTETPPLVQLQLCHRYPHLRPFHYLFLCLRCLPLDQA